MRAASLVVVTASLAAILNASPQTDFSAARAAAAGLPQLHSLLVSHRGELVLEYYAPNTARTRLANVKSASKSVIATLVGIAIERKLIPALHEPIVRWFPELRKDPDKRKQAITIEDLLTMRSGLESTSGRNYGRWVSSRNWVRYALEPPDGERSGHLDGVQHRDVAHPLGDPHEGVGQEHASVRGRSPREAARHHARALDARSAGHLLRRQRDADDAAADDRVRRAVSQSRPRGGRQVVPGRMGGHSCTPRTRSRWDPDREYGYGWWIQDFAGHRACFAWGFGGQYIFVFRDLDLVIVVTSSTTSATSAGATGGSCSI